MSGPLADRLRDALAGTPLAERLLSTAAASFLEQRGDDDDAAKMGDTQLIGLARLLASQGQAAIFLGRRPELLGRIAVADEQTLARRAEELASAPVPDPGNDLEAALDELRILRHEETCLIACLDLGGAVTFEAVSLFLSVLAETITRRALALARYDRGTADTSRFAVLGMGKIAGREFTYHSDLDLIFLHGGPPEAGAGAARVGHRLISYLGTMTSAGIAYAVDTRLRPSGRQGVLVTSFDGYRRYQLEQAQTWEHLALLRARPIAGDTVGAQQILDEVRKPVLAHESTPWPYIAELRQTVVDERARVAGNMFSLKAGRGGLMDVDFLASGGLLERPAPAYPEVPSVPAMLRAAATGPAVDEVLADYRRLRIVEARARWVAGRGVDEVALAGDALDTWAALAEPGRAPSQVASDLTEAGTRIRSRYSAVIETESIEALGSFDQNLASSLQDSD